MRTAVLRPLQHDPYGWAPPSAQAAAPPQGDGPAMMTSPRQPPWSQRRSDRQDEGEEEGRAAQELLCVIRGCFAGFQGSVAVADLERHLVAEHGTLCATALAGAPLVDFLSAHQPRHICLLAPPPDGTGGLRVRLPEAREWWREDGRQALALRWWEQGLRDRVAAWLPLAPGGAAVDVGELTRRCNETLRQDPQRPFRLDRRELVPEELGGILATDPAGRFVVHETRGLVQGRRV